MVKQKKSMDDGSNDERAYWKDLKELEAFYQFCAVQVMEGQRKSIGFLSKIGVNEVIRQLGEMGKVVTWLQIKNKWDHLKKGGRIITSVWKMRLGWVMMLELRCLTHLMSGGIERLRLVLINT